MRDHDAGAGEAAPGTFVISQGRVIDPAVGVESQAGIAVELVRGDVGNDLAPVLPAIEGYRCCRYDALHEGGTIEVEFVRVITADRVAWIVRIDGNRSFVVRRFRVAVQQHVAAVNCWLVRRSDRASDLLNSSNSARRIGREAPEIVEAGQVGT